MRQIRCETILDYEISTESKEACIDLILSWIRSEGGPRYFVCANPHSLEVAQSDSLFDTSIKSADLLVPDGVGVVMASKILGGAIRDRITGSDIFWGLNEALNRETKYSCYFLGSTDDTLEEIRKKMEREYPNIKVAGLYPPPFKPDFGEYDNKLMCDAVNREAPDVLWVGMTAPKQEKWVFRNRENLNVKFIGPVGAVFDFFVGKVKRSHPVFQAMGLEWLPRLLQEPRRLWRRNFISNPHFILRVIRSRFAHGK